MKRIFLMVLMFSMFAGAVSFTFSQEQPAKVEDKKLDGESTDESLKDKQPTAEELAYRADTATILKLLGNIRDFRSNNGDTQVQAKARKRKLKEALGRINARYKGTRVVLQRAELEDVTADKVLSVKGISQSQQIIAKMRQDPASAVWVGDGNLQTNDLLRIIVGFYIADCKDCWKETGKYKATYSISVPGDKEKYGAKYGIAIAQQKKDDDGKPVYKDLQQGLPIGQFDPELFQYLNVKIVKTYPNENSVINLQKGSLEPLTGTIRTVLYDSDWLDELTIWID